MDKVLRSTRVNQEEWLRLKAEDILRDDRIPDALAVLQHWANTSFHWVAWRVLLPAMMKNANLAQAYRISHLMDEHLPQTCPRFLFRTLLSAEDDMYARLGDVRGITRLLRKREHEGRQMVK